ncbi:glycoside hydrolase family 88 protein [Lactiplantibacillus modestisalitolerans]|uniref:Glycoside hydrolase family 88 protein n=1 Tax=Lactiplantibacillus modestisalitolerans TaxID=1457219 RepID=A0ABV5WST9_9LACO|nr:glycoside hydrolase family 88 protein [Lactiplantibacillus modestisalitolerans]
MTKWSSELQNSINQKVKSISQTIGDRFPHATNADGNYQLEKPQWWTAGFWPGILWQVFQTTHDEQLKEIAIRCEKQLATVLQDPNKVDHDAGFMWMLSSVYQDQLLHDETAKTHALLAANLLAARFNIRGNYLRAWNAWIGREDNTGTVIIDSVMNLPLLYWASEVTNDPRFKHIATAHADTILQHFVRDDGSVHHMVIFNAETGDVVEKLGGQGFAENSSWSRGCAWALYGFALAYKYTHAERFLTASMKVANYFLMHTETTKIALWDFRIPANTAEQKYDYPDSSANAIAACGCLLLADLVTPEEHDFYYQGAERLVTDLVEQASALDDPNCQGLIKHGTGHFPEQKNLDVSLIYGDYFFVEAVNTLNHVQTLHW